MLNILWDASHLWGYLLLHAVRSAELPHRLIRGSDIAQAGLSGKVLAVPGGSARRKARALGPAGGAEVLRFVAGGGHYLGFCGGAGLALADELGLCPWRRAGITDRLQHLVSGHVRCAVPPEAGSHSLVPEGLDFPLLPVWWPGRFDEPGEGVDRGGVEVLARYQAPGPDLYVADLSFRSLPSDVLAEWDALYGVTMRPSLLDGQPCVVTGRHGRGDWVLSYCHLETPAGSGPDAVTGDAGRWFFHLLRIWTGSPGGKNRDAVPSWNPENEPVRWEDPCLLAARSGVEKLTELALSLGLLFPRAPWLMGWRSGMPGAQFNSLRLAVHAALGLKPTDARVKAWKSVAPAFADRFRLFSRGARSWLLARRLADTLADALASTRPDVLPRALLTDQRQALFGSPMSSGGLCGELLDDLEGLLFAE